MIRNTAKNRFNIDKIKETKNNDIWINYKGLCDRLDIEYKSGNAKRAQLKELLLLCEYEKQGTKFKLLKLRSKEETRKLSVGTSSITYDSREDLNKKGVYALYGLEDNSIYIGSTMDSFKNRYHLHSHSSNRSTSNLITCQEHRLEILYIVKEADDRKFVRRIKSCYMWYYSGYKNYNLVNLKDSYSFKPKPKTPKSIKVSCQDYDKAIILLQENGVNIL